MLIIESGVMIETEGSQPQESRCKILDIRPKPKMFHIYNLMCISSQPPKSEQISVAENPT